MANSLLGAVNNTVGTVGSTVGGIVGGVAAIVTNIVSAVGLKPGTDATLKIYDSITKKLVETVIVKADALGIVTYETSKYINGESVQITGLTPTDFNYNKTQILKDYLAPEDPTAHIDRTGSFVTGTAEPNSTITVKDANGKLVGTGVTDTFGNYTVPLVPPKINSEVLQVISTDASLQKNESNPVKVTAPDATRPDAPTDLDVGQNGTVVTGKAEPNSKIQVKDASGTVIGTGTTDANGSFSVTLKIPQLNKENLSVNATDASGNVSDNAAVTAKDLTKPDAPTNLDVGQNGTVVTGKAEPNSTIQVKDASGTVIGTGTTDANGGFSVTLKTPQLNKENLSVNATDASGNTSADAPVTAKDLTKPDAPTELDVVLGGTVLLGKAEANTTIQVKDASGTVIGTGTTDANGAFAVELKVPQVNKEKLSVNATDASGNVSDDAAVNAKDLTKPDAPINLQVVQDGTVLTGNAEPLTTIKVIGVLGTVIGTGTTDANGAFRITLSSPQINSEKLLVNATDASSNTSDNANVNATDLTPPDLGVPVFNGAGTQLSGAAEANSTITVKDASNKTIGTAVTGADGRFVVTLDKAYGAGEIVKVTAADASGNLSVPRNAVAPILLSAADNVAHADLDLANITSTSTYSENKSFGSLFKFLGISILGKPAAEINFNVGENQSTGVDIRATNTGLKSLFDGVRVTLYKENANGTWQKVASNTDVGLFDVFFFFFPEQARIKTTNNLAPGNYKVIAEDLSMFSFISLNSLDVTYTTTTKSPGLEAIKANVVSGNVMVDDVTTIGTQVSKLVNADGKVVDVSANGSTTLVGKFGTILIKADGSYSYTPNKDVANLGKVDTFTYTIKNANGNTSEAKLFVQIGSDEVKIDWDPTDPSKPGTTLKLYNDVDTVKSSLAHTTLSSSVNSGSISTSYNKSVATNSNTFNIENNADSTIKVAFKAAFAKSIFGNSTYSTTQDPDDTTFKWQLQKFNSATNQWENVTSASGSKYISSGSCYTSGTDIVNAEIKVSEAGQYRVNFSTKTGYCGWTSAYDTTVQVTTTNLDQWQVNGSSNASGNIFNGVGVETVATDVLGLGGKLSISTDGGVTFKDVSATGLTVNGANGSLAIKADGSYTYTQTGSKVTTEDFVYKVVTSTGESATAHLTIGSEVTVKGTAAAETFTSDSLVHVLELGAGADTVKFTALNNAEHGDIWADFSKAEGDKIDVSSLLSGKGANATNISQYITIEQSGKDSVVKIDLDGKGTQYAPKELVILENNTTSLDELLKGNHIVF